ncbi:MAG TPA: TlpA disulfide reductase family protein [Gammaproteobacteria bacterium]|nr:TlpA disulfide reductase family protein [Gammaproteobacteria bacterium]
MRAVWSLLVTGIVALAVPSHPSLAAPPPELGPVEGKVVWVDFWASWCVPCRRSFPWMNTMHEKYSAQGLQIIAVNLDMERALADGFLVESPAKFAIRFDPEGKLAQQFDVQAMPSSFVLDADGKLIAVHHGFKLADTAEYEKQIQAALAGGPLPEVSTKRGQRK